jgi:Predicted kinase
MLCGIPTSGKSTYVEKLKKLDHWKDAVVLSTDSYIEKEAKRMGLTYNQVFDDVIGDATRELELQLNMAKDKGKNIIYDQTNLTIKTRRKKLLKIPSFMLEVLRILNCHWKMHSKEMAPEKVSLFPRAF